MDKTYFLYISILIGVMSFGYIAEKGCDISFRISARFLVFFFMLIPAMLRYNIGVDYVAYVDMYVNEFTGEWKGIEPGFKILGMLCNLIGIPSWLFIGIISGITYGLICFGIPQKYFFTVVSFYVLSFSYLYSYNNIRQYLAGSFLLCGLSYYYHDNNMKGWIYFIIAALIHYSSLIVFPFIILSHIKINKNLRMIIIIIIAIVFIFTDIAVNIINVGMMISPRYVYLTVLLKQKPTMNSGLSLVIFTLPSIMLLLNSKKIEIQSNGNFMLNMNAVYIITISMAYIAAAFARIYSVTIFISLFSIQILYDSKKKYRTLNYYIFLITFLAVFIRYIGIKPGAGIYPYNSIFNR